MNKNKGLRKERRTEKSVVLPILPESSSAETHLDRVEFFLACGVVFFAPMNFLRHPDIYVTLADVFAFGCVVVMVVNRTISLKPFGPALAPWMLGLTMLIGGLLASSLVNGSAERGLIVSMQYYVSYFLFPLIILGRPLQQVTILAKLFVLSILLVCIHGIYLIDILGERNTRFVSGSGRLRSFVERENELAGLIAFASTLLLWLGATGCVRCVTAWLTLLIMIYGVMLTGSNTGLLTMVFGFLLLFLATITWRRVIVAVVGMLTLSAIYFAWGTNILPTIFQKRVLGALLSGDVEKAGTFSFRYKLILEAKDMVNETLLLGVGANRHEIISQYGRPVHNAYLLIWSEGGLIALVGFLSVILAWVMISSRGFKEIDGRLSAACAFSLVIQFSIIANMVTHPYGRFWIVPIMIGLALVSAQTMKRRNSSFSM